MADIKLSGSGLGVASLALQIGDCVIRLKGFWDAVKEAPEEIKNLIEEIETLSLVLSGFEGGEHPEHNATSRCFQFCKRAVGILDGVVREVESEITKRKRVGSVKAVLKKGEIEKLRQRLATAQSMLMLSNNIYLVELQKRNQQAHHDWARAHQQELQQLRIIVGHAEENKLLAPSEQNISQPILTAVEAGPPTIEAGDFGTKELQTKSRKLSNHSARHLKLKARFWIPKWLFGVSRVIDVYETSAIMGWNYNIQIYNVLPSSAPIFQMVSRGNIEEVQHLFSTGQASPFVRNSNGWTLLDVGDFLMAQIQARVQANIAQTAAWDRNLELCRLLVNEGADPMISKFSSALVPGSLLARYKYNDDLFQLLGKDLELQDPFEDFLKTDVGSSENFLKHVEALAWIFRASYADYQHRSMADCGLLILRIVLPFFQPVMPGLIRRILKERRPDAHMCSVRDTNHNTLLHRATGCLGVILTEESRFDITYRREIAKELGSLITDFVKGGSDLHALTLKGQTPMLTFLSSCKGACGLIHNKCPRHTPIESPPAPLRILVEQLRYSGIDLRRYGRTEKSLWKDPRVSREWKCYEFGNGVWTGNVPRLHLINFNYGPEPGDWRFWIEPVMPNYFMQFWEMIDHPERAMPGAWEEGCSAYDRDYYDDYSDDE